MLAASHLSDRVALVTGASRGIGKAIALDLAAQGATVAIVSRNLAALSQTQSEIEGLTSKPCQTYACDVGEPETLESTIRSIQKAYGKLDIIVNNAGTFSAAALVSQDLESWRNILEVNLTAAMRASKAALPLMIERKWGRIVNISSISGKSGEPYGAAYSASKFGMIGMTQSLALEVARDGITVNAVCPGWVDTDMARDQLNDEEWCRLNNMERQHSLENARLSVPQERFIEPGEVANLVAYLCSESARGITGQAINICGGLSLH
ncbi:MAG: SDR family oxidoreductase [Cyanobacteria bacterium SZAS-4]|nr:SDR family oxidoreductase [Cyanobacteria bacterium SZAS-4]